jgi:hypothetical protein
MQQRLTARQRHQLQLVVFQRVVGLRQIIQLVAEQLHNDVALSHAECHGCCPFDPAISENLGDIRPALGRI